MKSIVPAVILAVAILLGCHLASRSMRYELGVTGPGGRVYRIDRQTGVLSYVAFAEERGGPRYLVEVPTRERAEDPQ